MSKASLVRTGYLDESRKYPLVIEPNISSFNLVDWAQTNREFIEGQLQIHGAILFRNSGVRSVQLFERFINAVSGELLSYNERTSPRKPVEGKVYTSTDHPASEMIFLHNEQSYNVTFPKKIFFFCMRPAERGGETPIADSRRIFYRIDSRIRSRFIQDRYLFVRNFGDGFGLSWQTAFQTTDRSVVEGYCRNNDIEFEWKTDGRLRTKQVRRVAASHPSTGESVWFNHLTFFNISTLDRKIRDELIAEFKEEDLPHNTYYGNGSPIESVTLDLLRETYRSEAVLFPWISGDILMLDNILMSHGRQPYSGHRQVVVGMSEICRWDNLEAAAD